MITVSVKELNSRLSHYLRCVSRGEHVRITRRGKPLADLLPAARVAEDARLRELVTAGKLSPAARPRPRRSPVLQQAKKSASDQILADRDTEP